MIIFGQFLRIPSWTCAKDADQSWGFHRGYAREYEQPMPRLRMLRASDSICSLVVTGTAGVSILRGIAPVIATVIMAGIVIGITGPVGRDG